MVRPAVAELRRVIADGLAALLAAHPGLTPSSVASAIRADRASATRWAAGSVTISYDNTIALARAFPNYFDIDVLTELHGRIATSGAPLDYLTVGLSSAETVGSAYELAVRSLALEPTDPRHRELLHVMLHVDYSGEDPIVQDRFATEADRRAVEEFRATIVGRASEGWRIRTVLATASMRRLDDQLRMLDRIDGPDVRVSAYVGQLPLVVCPLVIANRDVVLAFDDRRLGRPAQALAMRSPTAVRWARTYFEALFEDAPYRLRSARGLDASVVAAMRAAIEKLRIEA